MGCDTTLGLSGLRNNRTAMCNRLGHTGVPMRPDSFRGRNTAMTDLDPVLDAALDGAAVTPSAELRDQILGAVAHDQGSSEGHHLAQMNTARFRHPMDHPDLAGFVEMLDPLNHQADAAPGFVWRLTDEGSNDATSITFYDDPLLLVNLSVWTDLDSLRNYVYRTAHVEMVKRREEWADAMEDAYIVLWWVPAGHVPDVAEADARLNQLRRNGPTADAFTFGKAFPAANSRFLARGIAPLRFVEEPER